MENKVSVIIPVYKVEKYLEKCIDSVINQSYSNLEIILVDDGSPDNCGKICDKYAKKDNRIRVIHKTNGGLSDARNNGIKIATGNYIAFIDSDDYVTEDYIEYLLKLIIDNNSDISIVMPYEVDENYIVKKIFKREKIYNYNSNDALKTMLYQKKFETSAWGKLFKKNVVNGIYFPTGKIYEDIGTIYKYILRAKKITFSTMKNYYYLQRKDSIMGRKYKQSDLDYVENAQVLLENMEKIGNLELIKAAKSRFLSTNFSILLKLNKTDQVVRKKLLSNIKKYKKVVLFDKNVRLKNKVAILLTYINYF